MESGVDDKMKIKYQRAEGRLTSHLKEQGFALVMVLLLASIVMIFGAMGVAMVIGSQKDTVKQLSKYGQASNVAKAGLQDAMGWFKRQTAQPVRQGNSTSYTCPDMAFDPQYNADPLLRDTDNTAIGLVKDIKLSDNSTGLNIYGRYEIKRQPCTGASATPYDANALHDLTTARGKGTVGATSAEGIVWFVSSLGTVYIRNDMSKNGDGTFVKGPTESPNKVIDKARASVEINRISLSPPTVAITTAAGGTIAARTEIIGDSTVTAGVGYYGTAPTTTGASIKTTTATTPLTTTTVTTVNEMDIFAVTQTELRSLSDNIYTSISQMPRDSEDADKIKLPLSIVFLDGNFTFDSNNMLSGTGILYVKGNLTIAQNAFSNYTGVIFTTGTFTLGGTNTLAGAVIARGAVSIAPTADKAFLEYNSTIIGNVRRKLGLYRENRLTFQSTN